MTSARATLLEFAKQSSYTSDAVLRLGAEITSVETATARVAALQLASVKEEFWESFWTNLAYGSFASAVGSMALALSIGQVWLSVTSLAFVVFFIWAVFKSSAWNDRTKYHQAQMAALGPIAGTERCLTALAFVERAHPSVLAWRDLAVAERGQLYAFDVDIMGYLHAHEEARQAEAEKQLRNDEACRKVHGITPATA